MIELRALTRRFGTALAVDGVTSTLGDRGVVGLLGPNGAGKTTTIRMLAGVLSATSGTVRVLGFDVSDRPLEVRARVGLLPEVPALAPVLTVGETLEFAAALHGVPAPSRAGRVGAVMERIGLAGAERRLIGTLSRGYRQRVGMAQALMADPAVLILDEPTAGLDPAQLVGFRQLVTALAADRLVILSTHLLPEVAGLCDRVLLLHEGRLIGDGSVAALAAQAGCVSTVALHLDDPTDRSAAMAAVPAVQRVTPIGAGRYRLIGEDALEADLFRCCADAGWVVRRLAREEPTLEEVFLALVGGAP